MTDGTRIRCVDSEDIEMQNAFWKGYLEEENAINLLLWMFTCEIIHAAVSYPGSWHDNQSAALSSLYWHLLSDDITPPGYAIIRDSASVNN